MLTLHGQGRHRWRGHQQPPPHSSTHCLACIQRHPAPGSSGYRTESTWGGEKGQGRLERRDLSVEYFIIYLYFMVKKHLELSNIIKKSACIHILIFFPHNSSFSHIQFHTPNLFLPGKWIYSFSFSSFLFYHI